MKSKLTDRQAEILAFYASSKIPPTMREAAAHFGVNYSCICQHISIIRKKGYLTSDVGKLRTVRARYPQPDDIKSGQLLVVRRDSSGNVSFLRGEFIPADRFRKK